MKKEYNHVVECFLALISKKINLQINKILHAVKFQELESSWRGLKMLINESNNSKYIIIKMLNISLLEFNKDINYTMEFDQSCLFRKIHSEEFDLPGGEPFGLLVGDYYFCKKTNGEIVDSIILLSSIAKIAAASFSPFITSVSSLMFGFSNFSTIPSLFRFNDILRIPTYRKWKLLRNSETSSYLGIVLPRVLMRTPYRKNKINIYNNFFNETMSNHEDYLWGNGCYSYASVIIKNFSETGWFRNMHIEDKKDIYSKTINSTREYFFEDYRGLVPNDSVEYFFTDNQERLLNKFGFIVIRYNSFLKRSFFRVSQSVRLIDEESSITCCNLLHYVLCASRFAIYVKVIIRDKLGKFLSVKECEQYLKRWLNRYTSSSSSQLELTNNRYPLKDAKIIVSEQNGASNKYYCVIRLKLQCQLVRLMSYLNLVANISLN